MSEVRNQAPAPGSPTEPGSPTDPGSPTKLGTLIQTGSALLRDLYGLPEPVASVYFSMEDPAGDDVDLRRRTVRHHLLRAATGTVVLGAVEHALSDVPHGPGAVAVFVGRDASVRTFTMPDADLAADRVSRSALPDVIPFLRWQQYRPAYVLAVLGRTVTEVSVRHSPWSEVTTTTVPAPGDGASVPDYAAHSAETVAEALSGSGARLLIVAGDAQATRFFEGRLPDWVRQRVRVQTVPEGRSPRPHQGMWPGDELAAMVDARLREAVADVINGSGPGDGSGETGRSGYSGDTGDRGGPGIQGMQDIRSAQNVQDIQGVQGVRAIQGVQGVSQVIDALAHGDLRELLVGAVGSVGSFSSLGSLGPGGADGAAWFGPEPTDLAASRSDLAVADSAKRTGFIADVLIRAAVLTDAEVAILPLEMSEALHQGVGGIRR
jgi:Bacterial archaeo-eukaryotic release factor family 2